MPHDDDHPTPSRTETKKRVDRVIRKAAERSSDAHIWTRDTYFHDLSRASRRMTEAIESDAAQSAALDRSREQARSGDVISEDDFDSEAGDD